MPENGHASYFCQCVRLSSQMVGLGLGLFSCYGCPHCTTSFNFQHYLVFRVGSGLLEGFSQCLLHFQIQIFPLCLCFRKFSPHTFKDCYYLFFEFASLVLGSGMELFSIVLLQSQFKQILHPWVLQVEPSPRGLLLLTQQLGISNVLSFGSIPDLSQRVFLFLSPAAIYLHLYSDGGRV